MLNILTLVDNSWDNVPMVIRRFRKISPENKIHTIYSQQLKNIEHSATKCCLPILRHSAKTVSLALSNILSFCDTCIIFHNMIEYNTPTSIAIEICKENGIPYFIFPEYTKSYYFNNDSLTDLSFSKYMKTVSKREHKKIIFNNELLNDVTKIKVLPSMDETIASLQESYEKNKKTRQLITLYDKGAHKSEKAANKMSKAAAQLEFSSNRINYWKK